MYTFEFCNTNNDGNHTFSGTIQEITMESDYIISIHISNVSLTTAEGDFTRVGFRVDEGNKVRFSKKNNEIV